MPLLQCPGPAPDFATHAVVNGNIGHVALKDYQVWSIVMMTDFMAILAVPTKKGEKDEDDQQSIPEVWIQL